MSTGPVYSHGGSDEGGYPAIPGTGVSSGRPISTLGAAQEGHALYLALSGTTGQTKTVLVEGQGGQVDANGNLPAAEWQDYSGGGYVMVVGAANATATLAKVLPRAIPYWRTRIISAPDASVLNSYCPGVIGIDGRLTKANRPALATNAQITTQ
jgi:hypothetical protein